MFRDLSFRYKIPLRGSVLIVCTALVVTASLMFRAYEDLKHDLLLNAQSMARVLAHTLTPAILHDDVWRTYEIINSPFQVSAKANINQADEILVLDTKRQVYASTHPKQYPMLSDPARVNPDHLQLQQKIIDYRGTEPTVIEPARSGKFYMVAPIVSDGIPLGTLVLGFSNSIFLPRFYDIARRAMIITLLALAALLPISWYWGWRMAAPLTQLAGYMDKIGPTLPDDKEITLYESRDEIGQVGAAFKRMLGELKEKESLERQIFFSERLAAVGRLAAGIAHEINNPLGGMLNAISTFKKRDNDDPQTIKTISLLERGLLQIKDTIAALLVEAKFQSHPLTVQDIEDTRTLVLADTNRKSVDLHWENDVLDTLPLPSTLVRQILINLLLNALQAVENHGHLRCHIYRNSDTLVLQIENDGKHITSEQLDTLFEPFITGSESGHGLGLWMTYQIVNQLKGEITVESQPGETRFVVTLPIPESLV
ncbi:ATP-binding protein [Herbaspirillum sp. ST 5-3]|uniref:sensor histidine kinase n=1 Tax=Oxalobacteraceae TaxID=75682 RepID=UPI0010A55ED7|nr:ATP-binding protein [Herbaspirillum sp. ST 5-3]